MSSSMPPRLQQARCSMSAYSKCKRADLDAQVFNELDNRKTRSHGMLWSSASRRMGALRMW
jgi:hypothetical protein